MKPYSVKQRVAQHKTMITHYTRQLKAMQCDNTMGHLQMVDNIATADNNLLCKLGCVSELKRVDMPLNHTLVNHVDVL